MRVSITCRAHCRRRRRIRFTLAGERIITEHNAVSIKHTPSRCRFILNVSLRDHDEKVKRAGNETRGMARMVREKYKDGEARKKRERARTLPSSAPPQNPVDLAEHFNDSSLPRAFTAPTVLSSWLPERTHVLRNSSRTSEHHDPYQRPSPSSPLFRHFPSFPFDLLLFPLNLHLARHLHPHFHSRSFSTLIRRPRIICSLHLSFPARPQNFIKRKVRGEGGVF